MAMLAGAALKGGRVQTREVSTNRPCVQCTSCTQPSSISTGSVHGTTPASATRCCCSAASRCCSAASRTASCASRAASCESRSSIPCWRCVSVASSFSSASRSSAAFCWCSRHISSVWVFSFAARACACACAISACACACGGDWRGVTQLSSSEDFPTWVTTWLSSSSTSCTVMARRRCLWRLRFAPGGACELSSERALRARESAGRRARLRTAWARRPAGCRWRAGRGSSCRTCSARSSFVFAKLAGLVP